MCEEINSPIPFEGLRRFDFKNWDIFNFGKASIIMSAWGFLMNGLAIWISSEYGFRFGAIAYGISVIVTFFFRYAVFKRFWRKDKK